MGGWDRKSYFADVWRFRFETRAWHKVDVQFEYSGVGQHSLVVNKGRMYPILCIVCVRACVRAYVCAMTDLLVIQNNCYMNLDLVIRYLYGGYCSDFSTPHPHMYVFRLPKVYNAEA